MKLCDLILEMDKSDELPVLVDHVARLLENRGVRDDIEFVAADMNKEKVKGFIREWEYLPAPYSEPRTAARIYFANDLNECWKRYICAKELVHLLDGKVGAVDTAEKLQDLMIGMSIDLMPWLKGMQDSDGGGPVTAPVPVTCLVDYAAEWWAIPVLVPPTPRAIVLEKYKAKVMTDSDVAYTFRIPQKFVPFVVSPLYDSFVGALLNTAK